MENPDATTNQIRYKLGGLSHPDTAAILARMGIEVRKGR